MATNNIFKHPEEDDNNLSAPLEGDFANPHDDAGTIKPVSLGNTDAEDTPLVGSDGNVEDEDSSLTIDTDAPETETEELPDDVEPHDAEGA